MAVSSEPSVGVAIAPAVSGWLLLLCLILTVFFPASMLYAVGWRTIPVLVRSPHFTETLALTVYCAVFAGLAVFSVIAGLKLWTIKPHAVRFAKNFLATYLTGNIAYFLFWLFLTRPNPPDEFAMMAWFHITTPVAFTLLWYFYLRRSRRVRATYSMG